MSYKIPKKYTEEETFLKIFTKKSLLYTSASLALGFVPASFFYVTLKSQYTAIFIEILFAIPAYILGTIVMPKDRLYNGGEPIDKLILRKLRRMIDGKYIYVTRSKGR